MGANTTALVIAITGIVVLYVLGVDKFLQTVLDPLFHYPANELAAKKVAKAPRAEQILQGSGIALAWDPLELGEGAPEANVKQIRQSELQHGRFAAMTSVFLTSPQMPGSMETLSHMVNRSRGQSTDRTTARGATATLGLGCFWEPSETLLKLDGVQQTRCGYAGATFPDAKPDYNSVCGGDGNVECVRVAYDESRISYEEVLDAAFAASKPVLGSRQYSPIVFAANKAEAERAAAWVAKGGIREDGLERRQFSVEQTDTFWEAEGYHQEYWQKWRPRYASLFGLTALQYADSKLDFLPPAADGVCTAFAVSIGLLFLGERVLDSETTKVAS